MFFDKTSRASSSTSMYAPSTSAVSSGAADEQDGSDRRRRRVQRACDMCRLKKVKCEGGHPSRKACANCALNKYDCTYMQMARAEVKDKAYVQSLEARLAKMEQLVRKWCPDPDSDASPNFLDAQSYQGADATRPAPSMVSLGSHGAETPASVDVDSDEEEADARRNIEDYLKNLSITPTMPNLVGKSNTLMLVQTLLEAKSDGPTGGDQQHPQPSAPSPGATPSGSKAMHFWESHTWESRPSGPKHRYTFPESELLRALVVHYFKEHNARTPVLHRPTFERSLAQGLHFIDEGFGAVLLLVCALGSRSVNDERVHGYDEEWGRFPGGRWFSQVQRTLLMVRIDPPRLYDVQIATLASTFLTRTGDPQITCWLIVGHGIRMAQIVGAHRKKVYAMMPPVPRELLKRAFWALIKIDRDFSYYLGRPCSMQDEDFDVELPLECDDEYWELEDPSKAFKQPEGKPSNVTYWNCGLKLSRIQSYALRTIYSITKARVALGHVGSEWEERTVMELDSALNQWLASLPEHLRWNPNEPDYAILTQTACLHASFYNLQMIVHRPFLSPRRQRTATIPSMMICTNAARSALRILDVHFLRSKTEGKSGAGLIGTIVVAGIIMILNVVGAKRSRSTAHIATDMELVHKAAYMLMAFKPPSPGTLMATRSFLEIIRLSGLHVPSEADSPYTLPELDPHTSPMPSSSLHTWGQPEQPSRSTQGIHAHNPLNMLHPHGFDTEMSSFTSSSLAWGSPLYSDSPPPPSSSGGYSSTSVTPGLAIDHPTDDFMRTLEDLAPAVIRDTDNFASIPTFGTSGNTGHMPFEWSGGAGAGIGEGGPPGIGLQWEEWGSLFASAFGGEGFDYGGGDGGADGERRQ